MNIDDAVDANVTKSYDDRPLPAMANKTGGAGGIPEEAVQESNDALPTLDEKVSKMRRIL